MCYLQRTCRAFGRDVHNQLALVGDVPGPIVGASAADTDGRSACSISTASALDGRAGVGRSDSEPKLGNVVELRNAAKVRHGERAEHFARPTERVAYRLPVGLLLDPEALIDRGGLAKVFRCYLGGDNDTPSAS